MILGDDVAGILPELREQAESMMRDKCTITGVVKVWDEATLSYVETDVLVYTGKCELKSENVQAAEVDAQGQLLVVQSLVLKLPVDESAAVRPGHTATITVCEFDPSLAGQKFRVKAPHNQSFATARRFPVERAS